MSVPETGDGTSVSTLSVDTSNNDFVTDLLKPLSDGALGNRFAELGKNDVCHGESLLKCECVASEMTEEAGVSR